MCNKSNYGISYHQLEKCIGVTKVLPIPGKVKMHIYNKTLTISKKPTMYNSRDFPITYCAARYTDRIATRTISQSTKVTDSRM